MRARDCSLKVRIDESLIPPESFMVMDWLPRPLSVCIDLARFAESDMFMFAGFEVSFCSVPKYDGC